MMRVVPHSQRSNPGAFGAALASIQPADGAARDEVVGRNWEFAGALTLREGFLLTS